MFTLYHFIAILYSVNDTNSRGIKLKNISYQCLSIKIFVIFVN